eukprot:TRINITY_DN17484_c0_g1_i1.p1 TRINITY_DN17484_c0_g1~~TRINITY_DN17484_c0_g1_i1.p1  ORF type:complete len:140 (+),score=24.85 TRINITY_DN17484_c0_g1_i1:103-522(+)
MSESLSDRPDFKEWLKKMPPSAPKAIDAIRSLVASERCVMFSTTWCPWCDRAQAYVESESGGRSCRKINLDEPPKEIADSDFIGPALSALTGQTTVPNLFIAKKHIGGFSQLVDVAKRCKENTLPEEHQDICQFLAPAK